MKNKIIEKKLIEEEIIIESYKTCDLCGYKVNILIYDESWPNKYNFDYMQTEVKMREFNGYDEVISEYDICPKCFKEKLIPWIKNNNISSSKI